MFAVSMGFFSRRKSKKTEVAPPLKPTDQVPKKKEQQQQQSISTVCPATTNPTPKGQRNLSRQKSKTDEPRQPTMEMLSQYIEDLQQARETSSDPPALALRMLFALSEHGHTTNRTDMVRGAEGKLVPALLEFLNRCDRGSSEQYLTLLVLNNISIPTENKRVSSAMLCASEKVRFSPNSMVRCLLFHMKVDCIRMWRH